MIVKIGKAGASFKGLANYLTEAKERVAWTHSLNCANDDVLSVVHEMYTTFSDAELLKEESGTHGGGKPLENPVKHISLSWHPSEHPTREQMIEAAQSFLKEMAWDEHQALLVSHHDQDHRHVHIELNRVHPETGLALNERFERVRAQDWALDYEREHGNILCEQRLLDREERTPSPTRETWEKLRESEKTFEREEAARRETEPDYLGREERREIIVSHEWEILKERQRAQRENFIASGKDDFKEVRNEVYVEVRETFRPEWKAYYEAKRSGGDADDLAEMKTDILGRQRTMLDERRTEVCAELRQERDQDYKELLLIHKQERHELHAAQDRGERSYSLLNGPVLIEWDYHSDGREPLSTDASGVTRAFAAAAQEIGESARTEPSAPDEFEPIALTVAENPRVRDGLDAIGGLGLGAAGAIAAIGERLFDGFFGASPSANQNQPPKPEPQREPRRSDTAREQAVARAIEAASRALEAEHDMRRRDDDYWRVRRRERE